jgi:L-arabinose isomerase
MTARREITVGLFSLGLHTYWPQFPGLEQRLNGYNGQIAARAARPGVRIENLGIIDTPAKAFDAGHRFRQADVDLILLHLATYGLSSCVLPVVRRAKAPVVVLNLAPGAAIDYAAFNQLSDRAAMTGEWLAWCGTCPAPEISSVFQRARIPFFQITGTLAEDDQAWNDIDDWIEAARVIATMEHNRLGLLGHYYGGMLDVYSDLTQQCATFGGHVEFIEVDELSTLRQTVPTTQVQTRVAEFRNIFAVQPDCSPDELERAAKTSLALDRLVAGYDLGSLAYYYRGQANHPHDDAISSIILGASLLTGRGIPVAGEYEVKNVQAMKIMDTFGAGGSFSEYYAIDFDDDVVLLGHDGPGHISIAEGKVNVRPLGVYHGKQGRGLSVEMSVKYGPVTLLSVVQGADGRLKLLTAEATSEPGPILEIGNTNGRYRFTLGARGFINAWNAAGPAHHCAIGAGHISSKLQKFAALTGMDYLCVC